MSVAGAADPFALPEVCLVVILGGPAELREGLLARAFAEDERAAPEDLAGELDATVEARLAAQRLTAVDLTGVDQDGRQRLARIAKDTHTLRRAILIDLPDAHGARPPSAAKLAEHGFKDARVLRSAAEVEALEVTRVPLSNDRRGDPGPFDVIGDIHGCLEELETLLDALGYARDDDAGRRHPDGRRVIFLGDLVDRGPDIVGVLGLVGRMVAAGQATCLRGNHEVKLLRWLEGKPISPGHGAQASVEQLEAAPAEARAAARRLIEAMPYHLRLDGGRLVVAHAGLDEALQGREGGRARSFAIYGDTTGEKTPDGLPVRLDWAARYAGEAAVVYGHTPVRRAVWRNNTICVDTGCVFGGALTALRWPEREVVSVPATRVHYAPVRPLA